jgi:aspartyl-tRNA(Asn)/glutamyl-tRNA(Gln) amidotransferase subunit C
MPISREDVLRIAHLANLELSPDEVEQYRAQLDSILTYIGKLNELNTAGVEPMAQVFAAESAAAVNSTLRDDIVATCDTAKEILPQAPDSAAPYFRVPKVIERS